MHNSNNIDELDHNDDRNDDIIYNFNYKYFPVKAKKISPNITYENDIQEHFPSNFISNVSDHFNSEIALKKEKVICWHSTRVSM